MYTKTRHWYGRIGRVQFGVTVYVHHYGPGDRRLVVHPKFVMDL